MNPENRRFGIASRGDAGSSQPCKLDGYLANLRLSLLWALSVVVVGYMLAACKDDVPAFFAKHLGRRYVHALVRQPEPSDSFVPRRQSVFYDPVKASYTVREGWTEVVLTADGRVSAGALGDPSQPGEP
jgi:hypothetical protein